jgi:hypothetical protein
MAALDVLRRTASPTHPDRLRRAAERVHERPGVRRIDGSEKRAGGLRVVENVQLPTRERSREGDERAVVRRVALAAP